jgi:hypothetical protein
VSSFPPCNLDHAFRDVTGEDRHPEAREKYRVFARAAIQVKNALPCPQAGTQSFVNKGPLRLSEHGMREDPVIVSGDQVEGGSLMD